MLMFAKVSIRSFLYDIIDVFSDPDESIQDIYSKYYVKKCFLYKKLIDTDTTSLSFVFVCDLGFELKVHKALFLKYQH